MYLKPGILKRSSDSESTPSASSNSGGVSWNRNGLPKRPAIGTGHCRLRESDPAGKGILGNDGGGELVIRGEGGRIRIIFSGDDPFLPASENEGQLMVLDSPDLPTTMDEAVAYWLDEVEQVPTGEPDLNIFERTLRHLDRRGWSKYSFLTLEGRVSLPQPLCDVMNSFEELRRAQRELAWLVGPRPGSESPADALFAFNKDAETTEIDVVILLQRAMRLA
jgi:hypothetical protein